MKTAHTACEMPLNFTETTLLNDKRNQNRKHGNREKKHSDYES